MFTPQRYFHRRFGAVAAALLSFVFPTIAFGARVYILRGGDPVADNLVRQALLNRGHSANLGVSTGDFDGTQVNLTDFDSVVALNQDERPMTAAGKSALQSYLFGGGRLVTAEWFVYKLSGDSTLGPLLAATYTRFYSTTSTTYTQVQPVDPIIQNGLPPSFSFSLTNNTGTGVCFKPVTGAKVFYMSDIAGDGQLCPNVVGRQLSGGGRIIHFGTLAGAFEMYSPEYARLFVNAVDWAVAGTAGAPASLAARPGRLSFYYQIGSAAPASQVISLSSSGAAVPFSASASTAAGGAWLSTSATGGATPSTLAISVNPAGLAPGVYSAAINITGSGVAPQTVPTTLTVATGVRVYVFRGGDPVSESAVSQALQNAGHSVSLGLPLNTFDGTQVSLTDFDAVVALNQDEKPMTAAGKSALQSYLFGGGRLVTAEWFVYKLGGDSTLGPLLAATYTKYYSTTSTTYTQAEPVDPIIQNGLPPSFSFSLTNNTGTGSCFKPVTGAKVFYFSDLPGSGEPCPNVVGGQLRGGGRIIHFGTLAGVFEMQSPEYAQVFANAVNWAAAGAAPPPSALSASPTMLTFSAQQGGSGAPAQSISVSSSAAQIAFTATASTTSGGGWLTVNPPTGVTPAALTVSADPTGLAPGVYSGAVSIIASGAAPVAVPVSFTVVSNCGYNISPASQVFTSTGGAGTIGISTSAGCAWSAVSNAPWLTITSGSSGSGPGTLAYSVAANTAPAARSAAITISGLTFTVTQSGTSALFLVGPSPLIFNFREGNVQTKQQFLFVYGSSPGLAFTETVSGGSWLSVTPASGMAPTSPIVNVNPSGLAAGNYQGTITVTVPNANPATQTVTVEVFVEPAGPGHLDVQPVDGLSFSFIQGAGAQTSRISVSNLGGGVLTFQVSATAASNGAWLSVAPPSGSATAAASVSITVTADPTGLPAGTYTGSVRIASSTTGETANIPITMTVSAVQQTMLLSQTGLSFTAVSGGGSVPPQTVGVLNLGQGLMSWSAAATTLSGGAGWLTVTPGDGSTDAASLTVPLMSVGVNQAGLAPGEYYGQIQVSSSTADNSPQIISVVLDVLPPGSDPGPLVRPTGLIFTGVLGNSSPGSQAVTVSNLSSGSRSFTSGSLTTDGASWFNHLPAAGAVAPSQPAMILVQASVANLTAGVRRGVLTLLFADGSVRNVNILLVLSTGAPGQAKSARGAIPGCAATRLVPVFSSIGDQFDIPAAWPTALEAVVVDDCGAPLATGSVVASFSNGDPSLSMVSLKDGRWTGTWAPRAGAPQVSITLDAEVPGAGVRGTAQIQGGLRANSAAPQIANGGVTPLLAPGSVVSITGTRLADTQASASQPPLPTQLGGASVLLGAMALPLFSASDQKIQAQVPYEVAVNTRQQLIVLRGSSYTAPEPVTVAPAQPVILTIYDDGAAADQTHPVQPGDTLTLYCSGLGAVDPPVAAGVAAPDPPSQVSGAVAVTIAGVVAQFVSASLTPGVSGMYQVTVTVPPGVPSGPAPVVVSVAGQSSEPVNVTAR